MSLRSLLREADRRGLGRITWRLDDDAVYCFAERAGFPHVARGCTGRAALYELLRCVKGLGR